MSRVFFRSELEGVATFWRILRRDGVTLGFTGHDLDLWFDGILHRAAPGMAPSAIRRSADLSEDSAEVQGVLSHDSISAADLAAGRFDGAEVRIGAVDWETLENAILYHGTIGSVAAETGGFVAQLGSAKSALARDPIPRTSPTCRARFCGPGCTLSAPRFTHEARLSALMPEENRLRFDRPSPGPMRGGQIRWIDGPHAGLSMTILAADAQGLLPDQPLDPEIPAGTRAFLREGCDRTIASCAERFGNAANFQGEPFLPGNDLLARYPQA